MALAEAVRARLKQRKAQAPVKTRKALEGLKIKAPFAFNLRTEATRGARR